MKSEGYHAFDIRFLILGLIFLVSTSVFAQKENQYSAKDFKRFAVSAERNNDPETAAIYYSKYIDKKPDDYGVLYELAELNRFLGNHQKASGQYKSIIDSKKSNKYPLAPFYYAEMLVADGKCEEAIPVYEQFRKDYRGEKEDRKYTRLAKFAISGCEMNRNNSISKNILIEELNNDINGSHMEGSPVFLSNDEIIYNSLKTKGKSVYEVDSDLMPSRSFYVAKLEEGEWQDKKPWSVLQNFNDGEIGNGAFNMEKTRFYFSACITNPIGEVTCDLFRIDKNGANWSQPIKLPTTVNTRYTETQIAVGTDEKGRETIYFVSNRKEGKGGLDIWYSTYYENKDEYREAKNCGSKVNSVGDEITPFINPMNRQLFFSSNGHPNYGGFDVFKSAGERSRWSEPENIGKSINTNSDELYYTLNSDGDAGIFASSRKTKENKKLGACCDNLFYFTYPDFVSVSYSASVQDEKNNNIEGADYQLFQKSDSTGETFLVKSGKTDENGNIDAKLEPNQDYSLLVKKEDFYTLETEIESPNSPVNTSIDEKIKMKRITKESVTIENIYYEFDKSDLTKESKESIKRTVLKILAVNPQLIVEIGSHTDGKGTEAYNKSLSQARAESVVKYLISEGIPKENLVAKGYGESKPIEPNQNADGSDNPEGRAKNRRTEFRVVGSIEFLDDDDDDY